MIIRRNTSPSVAGYWWKVFAKYFLWNISQLHINKLNVRWLCCNNKRIHNTHLLFQTEWLYYLYPSYQWPEFHSDHHRVPFLNLKRRLWYRNLNMLIKYKEIKLIHLIMHLDYTVYIQMSIICIHIHIARIFWKLSNTVNNYSLFYPSKLQVSDTNWA